MNSLRGLLFYALYVPSMIFYTSTLICVGPFLSEARRYQLVQWFARYILRLTQLAAGLRYEIIGMENIPAEPCVVCANHESAWETYCLGSLFQPQSAVLKKELLAIPFYGWAVRFFHPIAIDRSKPTTAIKQLLRQGQAALEAGRWVVIYPEGTRVHPGEVVRYNKGAASLAARAGVPILPVAHNAGDGWPKGRLAKRPGRLK
ncbi:MAG: 1-acyl-sn-glycerol-3-phosphate acyltransferase, partial [Gammaproteobacteria bacterium]